jgi:tRNA-specific 2-thiouridylase
MVEVVGDASRDGRWALVRLVLEGDRIVSAEADGLERPLAGLTLLEAAAVGGDELAADALANPLGPVFRAAPLPGRVAVAMSGGVDSAVALLRAGPNAIGVTLRLWLDPQGPDTERTCCSPEAVITARATCHSLGIPHVTLDLREEFRRAVVEPFVRGYARGQTPNPCIRCNGSFRFAELLAFAERAGAERLATGHYARIVERDGRLLLARAEDERKDQSYMLARLDPRFLERLWFPLGEQGKDETRAEAARAGLEVASRGESQEACFLAGGDYRKFLERHGLPAEDGSLVDEDGNVVGSHAGFWRFTPGQRKGLGVSAPEPLYVLATDAAANTVTVGPRSELATSRVRVRDAVLHRDGDRVDAIKLRYRAKPVPASVSGAGSGGHTELEVELGEPFDAASPGQAAVLLSGEAIVGHGTIASPD